MLFKMKIVFKSGYVEELMMDGHAPENITQSELEDQILSMSKYFAGHTDNSKSLDAIWALASNNPIKAFTINTKEVAFVSVTVINSR